MNLAPYLEEATQQEYPAGTLYVVATPIGNLADMSLRALAVLMRCDRVAAEDTRISKRLLNHFGLDKPCIAVHRHNERAASGSLIEALGRGERIAYLSDAGTPAISDPGARLVDSVREAGLRVVPVPGASAAVCALSAAGLTETAFYFLGFLPTRTRQAERLLTGLQTLAAQLVLYEAPQRILDTIDLLTKVFGPDRRVIIARELTKLFEHIERLALGNARAWLEAEPNRQRGEFVLIIEARPEPVDLLERATPILSRLLESLPLSEAVALTAELTGVARKELYACALTLKENH